MYSYSTNIEYVYPNLQTVVSLCAVQQTWVTLLVLLPLRIGSE